MMNGIQGREPYVDVGPDAGAGLRTPSAGSHEDSRAADRWERIGRMATGLASLGAAALLVRRAYTFAVVDPLSLSAPLLCAAMAVILIVIGAVGLAGTEQQGPS